MQGVESIQSLKIIAKLGNYGIVIVEDENAEKVTETIKKAAYSGKIGDGKIFIYDIDKVIRIRTGEKDSDAV